MHRKALALICLLGWDVAAAQSAQRDAAVLLRSAKEGDRAKGLARSLVFTSSAIGPELRSALVAALNEEGKRFTIDSHGRPHAAQAELLSGLAQQVAQFRDPAAIPGLVAAVGISPPAMFALADFGQVAAAELVVRARSPDPAPMMASLIGLRLLAERRSSVPLSTPTVQQMKLIALRHLTGVQRAPAATWFAIDLAVALEDDELRGIVHKLATDRAEVARLGIVDESLVARTQRLASQRLKGVPATPRRP